MARMAAASCDFQKDSHFCESRHDVTGEVSCAA
jgi:hypothetical protein